MRTLLALVVVAGCSSHATAPRDLAPSTPPYTLAPFDHVRIGSQSAQANFQRATASVDFHDGPFASATLVLDLGTTCFPFSGWASDPPPAGQNWPADCDAFDRNFEVTLDEPKGPGDPPAVELSRAITPFGGPMHLEVDVTDVANGLPGPHALTVTIPTWSDAAGQVTGSNGGWTVSAKLVMTPGAPPRRVLAVVPLFNLSQDATTPPKAATFTTPAGTVTTRLEYRATGHGGAMDSSRACIGPAEEFCDRTHHVLLDGSEVQAGLMPWRNDCDQNCTVAHYTKPGGGGFDYCKENPCGDMNSVTAPRANWCPGTATPPFTWDVPAAHTVGQHQLSYQIDGVAPGGTWRLSAVFFAFGS